MAVTALAGAPGQGASHAALPAPTLVEPAPLWSWTCQGGNPARSRATATPGLRVPPQRLWEWSAPGTLVGEPLVSGDWVVVEVQRSSQARSLVVLDRGSGRRLGAELTFPSAQPLGASLWGNRLVLRSGPGELSGFRLGPRGAQRAFVFPLGTEIGQPLLDSERLYLVVDGDLCAFEFGAREPSFVRPERFLGPLALREGELAALALRPRLGGGSLVVARVDARSGEQRSWRQLVPDAAGLGELDAATVVPLRGGDLVHFAGRLALDRFQSHSIALFGAENRDGGDFEFEGLGHRTPPLLLGDGWLVAQGDPDPGWLRVLDRRRAVDLYRPADEPRLASRGPTPVAAGTVACFAGLAVDLLELRVLYALPPAAELVPLRDGWLQVTEDRRRLAGWLAPPPTGQPFDPRAVARLTWRSDQGLAVFADGRIWRGELALQDGELRQGAGRGAERAAVESLALLAEDPPAGTPQVLWCAGSAALRGALTALRAAVERDSLAEMVRPVVGARDPQLTARALDLGYAVELESRELERLEALAADLAERPHTARRGGRDELAARLAGLEGLGHGEFWRWAQALTPAEHDDGREALAAAAVESLLELDGGHRGALDWVRARAPAGAQVRSGPEALDWLRYLATVRRVPVELLEPAAPGTAGAEGDGGRVHAARERWRDDLRGLRSRELLLITPLAQPGSIARILAHGEALCSALQQWFAPLPARRTSDAPLEVRLYTSRLEYLAQGEREAGHAGLEWTSGSFDPAAGLSRLFVEPGPEGFERALGTFLHETTHQWLELRCPALGADEAQRRPRDLPGFWLVEGFASLTEDLTCDLETGRVEPGGALGARLPLVASAPAGSLLPWEQLFAHSYDSSRALLGGPTVAVPLVLRPGSTAQLDGMGRFYAQAAAAARYLFEADGGRHRRALLEALVAHYRGDRAGCEVAPRVGLSAAELGARIEAWSREQVAERLGLR
jgi:hypothetical protein